MKQEIPPFIKPFLWSYDMTQLDVHTHKDIIIKGILNNGNIQSISWLKKQYSPQEIHDVIATSTVTEWNKRSIALWSVVYATYPKEHRL